MITPHALTTVADLEALYGQPAEASTVKEVARITPQYRAYIEASPFASLATSGPEGLDCSPRGDRPGFVRIHDEKTLMLPDRRGNNRIDSLRNIVRDGRVSLIFLIPGATNAIRINGTARLTADDSLRTRFARDGKQPRSVIVIKIAEVYSQCARALIRSALWTSGDQSQGLPTVGDMLREITEGRIDGKTYDADWPGRAAGTMW